ncbi:MAG: DUF3604 domain-containing protein [Gammaproteobacteria bacterium]|nr:DUF3604 domain-containing protein [Gammaproteobacteria bacterium]
MSRTTSSLAATVAAPFLLAACGTELPSETVYDAVDLRAPKHRAERVRCRHHVPTRQAFFGDLHVHTALSLDAWSLDVRVGPDGAYRYAFGESIRLPLDGKSEVREVRIDRPLDFAAVTDHAEFLGEQALCRDVTNPSYESGFCQSVRSRERLALRTLSKVVAPFSWRDRELCGADGERCAQAAQGVWREVVAAAERWNDASADCRRTTFVGYEYSSLRLMSNLHRNVIFRNAVVPNRPISYLDATREWDLWRLLKERCQDAGAGCEVLAIPHNSNISNGRMFAVDYPGAGSREAKRQRAELRADLEPLVEIMQHKGNSECRNGLPGVLGDDEECGFEPFVDMVFDQRQPEGVASCRMGAVADWMPHSGPDCLSPLNYVRYALIEGLRQERELGVNPFKFGLIGSTDTHNATAGAVSERTYQGHLGYGDDTVAERVQFGEATFAGVNHNPGGLIGIWAEENSRDALFDAMQRRETFATSGPRIRPRFFGGWNLAPDLCERPDRVAEAYARGVPMGGDLPLGDTEAVPAFLVSAIADSDGEATPLQRLQVVKGWVDDDGQLAQQVFEVAGDPHNGAGVDPATCARHGEGFAQLCAVWRDPAFESTKRAVYYLRALENPSCRYSAWQCLAMPPEQRPADCADPQTPIAIQERAWSSPIWYTPPHSHR